MAVGTSECTTRDRRSDMRRPVAYRATLQIGATSLFGTVVDFARAGACVRVTEHAEARVGEWGVLTGEGPLATGFGARLVGISGKLWHVAFDPVPVWVDHFETGLIAPDVEASDMRGARISGAA